MNRKAQLLTSLLTVVAAFGPEDLVDVVSLSEAHTKLLSLVRLVGSVVGLWLILDAVEF